jgi:hypothetical protein
MSPNCQMFGSGLFLGRLECDLRRLAVPQRDNRVDAHSAARGNVAGGQRDKGQHDGDGRKRERVSGADAVENGGHQAR